MKKITYLLMLFLFWMATTGVGYSQVTIGTANNGSSTNSTPIAPFYGFSYAQSIYLASEINANGNITSLNFKLNPGTVITNSDNNVDVWIGHTTKSSFSSTTDWVAVSTLTQVLTNGTVTAVGDVLTITFSTPFAYNGTDNLIIAVDANEPAFDSSASYVWQTTSPANTSLYLNSDTVNANPASPASGTRSALRGNITINGITPACIPPTNLSAVAATTTTANLSWTPATGADSGSEWRIVSSTGLPTDTAIASGTTTVGVGTATATGLTSGTSYRLYVRSNCGMTNGLSSWAGPQAFAQIIAPGCASTPSPVDGATGVKGNVTFTWVAPTTGGTATGYDFFLGTVSGSLTNIGTITGTSANVSGLVLGATYYWRIVPKNAGGTATGCPEWSFTLKNPPSGPAGITCPSNNNTNIFTEAFTALGGWTGNVGSGTANNLWNFGRTGGTPTASTGPSAGQNGAYMYYESSGASVMTRNAISPAIDLTLVSVSDPTELSFFMHAYGAGIGTLNVGVSTSVAGPFTNIFTFDGQIQTIDTAPFVQVGVNLSAYSGQIIYLQFSYTSTALGTGDIAIDTLRVESCANICNAPTNLVANNFTLTPSVDLSWTAMGNATGYAYEIQPQGIAQGAGTPISSGTTVTNSATATGAFVSGSTYTLYVQTNCSFGNSPYAATNFTFIPAPANDNCANAISLTPSLNLNCATPVSGTTIGATQSLPGCLGTADDDVWYSFVATGSQHTIIINNATGSGTSDIVTQVFNACGGTSIVCQDSPNSPIVLTGLTPTATYVFRIYSFTSTTTIRTSFTVCVGTPPAPPANDNCAGAIGLTVNAPGSCAVTTTADHTSATDSGATYSCDTTAPPTNIDTWYTFVAPASGNMTFAFTNGTQTGTPKMAIFDACGGTQSFCSTTGTTKTVTGLTPSTIYTMSVWYDDFNTEGTFTICASVTPPPPANDNFANATVLTVGTNCNNVQGTLVSATNSPESIAFTCGTSTTATTGNENDVWYQFVAPANGNVTIQLSAATTGNLDTVMVIYAPDGVTPIACNDDLGSVFSGLSLTGLTSGSTYYAEIHEFGNDATGTFNICAFSPQCSGVTTTWNGTAWAPSAPTNVDVAIINGAYTTGTNGNIDACALIVNSGRTLTVSAGGYVKAENDITVAGTLNVIHTGSVVQVNDASTTVNTGIITVRKTTPSLAARAFMIMGSPMTAETRTGVYNSYVNVQQYIPGNFVPNAAVASMFPTANNFADDNGDDWQIIPTGTATVLAPGKGNLVIPQTTPQGTGAANPIYTLGTLNNGAIPVAVQYNGTQNGSPNMLGNPYASAIDADLFGSTNNTIVDVVYFWEHLTAPSTSYPGYNSDNYNMGDISQYNTVSGVPMAAANGGTVPNKYIASGQGFAIKALAPGTVTFNNAMRVVDNNNTYRDQELELFYINVQNSKYGLGSTTAVNFTENATNGYDAGYDNTRMATPVSVYGQLATGEELGIQSRGEFDVNDQVTVGFSTQVAAVEEYKVSLQNVSGDAVSNATVYLIDNLNGNVTKLSEIDYTFTSNAGTFANRFTVVFRDPTLGVSESSLEAIAMYPNPANNVVNISSPATVITAVSVIDMSGRVIENVSVNSQATFQLNIAQLNSAVYFVKITTANGIVTKRLIKK